MTGPPLGLFASRIRGLYAVLDPFALPAAKGGGEAAESALEEALGQILAGGCRLVQYRDKSATAGALLARARRLARICGDAGALFIVNDRLDVALLSGAGGCHLGQEDLPAGAARRFCPPGFVLGISTGSAEEAVRAARDGADYVGVGAIFRTTSKGDAGPPRGPRLVAEVAAAVDIPVVAIGGITLENVREVIRAGAAASAVLSNLLEADDIGARAEEFARIWDEELRRR